MSDVDKGTARCGNPDCGYIFHVDDMNPNLNERIPCPNCGSLKRDYSYIQKTYTGMVTYLQMEMRKPESAHKGNRPDLEGARGITIGRNGKHVFKKKVTNRMHPESEGLYVEYVRDFDGNILVNKFEKLSEHTRSKRKSK